MTSAPPTDPKRYFAAIRAKGLSIYDPITVGDPIFWIPTPELQALLDNGLRGLSLAGLPLRTRSKVVKTRVCEVLGYPVPMSFQKTQPRFPGQLFDTYTQKSNNLQVWNEELSASRRYVIIRISETPSVPATMRQRPAGSLPLRAQGSKSDGYARIKRKDACRWCW